MTPDDEQLKQLGKPDLRELMAMVTDLLTLPAPSRSAAGTFTWPYEVCIGSFERSM